MTTGKEDFVHSSVHSCPVNNLLIAPREFGENIHVQA